MDVIVTLPVLFVTANLQEMVIPRYGSRILLVSNQLVVITNSTPLTVTRVNVTFPNNPTWVSHQFSTLSGGRDIIYNSVFDLIYIACSGGKVLQLDGDDFSIYSIITTGDNNNFLNIAALNSFLDVYAGTNDTSGEILFIDNSTNYIISTNIQCLEQVNTILDLDIRTLQTYTITLNVQALTIVNTLINLDIRCLAGSRSITGTPDYITSFDEIALDPIKQTDFHVYINSVEVSDVELDSIEVYHAIEDEKSRANFILRRRHDAPNTIISTGGNSQITSQNSVQIYILDRLEFTGNVDSWNSRSEEESIEIIVKGTLQSESRKTITIPYASTTEKLSTYHCLLHNPNIFYPNISSSAKNPEHYLGIAVDLGFRIVQKVSQFRHLTDVTDDVLNGTFQPKQNWTYFWFARASNKFTGKRQGTARYVGTSPATLTSDVWTIESLTYRYQREFEDSIFHLGDGTVIQTDFNDVLGDTASLYQELKDKEYVANDSSIRDAFKFLQSAEELNLSTTNKLNEVFEILTNALAYKVGSPPYNYISTHNGKLLIDERWVDKPNGLYTQRDAYYDYEDYAKQIAALEYSKLLNINGAILPKTSCDIELMIDGYYFYGVKLLTRINIDNTTESNIFKGNNGFPVAVKAIEINSRTMRIVLRCDNSLSTIELEEIDDDYPDENSNEFTNPESSSRQFTKYDYSRNESVE